MTELNILHPFRDGNGRSKRAFVTQLASEAGYQINFSKVSSDQWHTADAAAFDNARDGDYNDDYLQHLLSIAVEKKQLLEKNASEDIMEMD